MCLYVLVFVYVKSIVCNSSYHNNTIVKDLLVNVFCYGFDILIVCHMNNK